MEADALADRLERDGATATVTAFPDGSVDAFFGVSTGGTRVDTREAFADRIGNGGKDVFALRREAVEPGGHATNLATQAHHLGNEVSLAGHLDDPAFADLPFATVSMGDPSAVSVYGFDDGDVLAVDTSDDVENWSLADLEAALGDDLEEFLTADAVCAVNWTSVEGLPDALASLAAAGVDGEWLIVDPGSVAGRSGGEFDRLFDALARLAAGYDVVLAGNPGEVEAMASGLRTATAAGSGRSTGDVDRALAELRARAGLAGAVVHGESRAAVATPDGVVADENFDVKPVRHTGGGDRFDAGLAHALARGWSWADALRLGNACASRYIATGDAGTAGDLAAFLRERG